METNRDTFKEIKELRDRGYTWSEISHSLTKSGIKSANGLEITPHNASSMFSYWSKKTPDMPLRRSQMPQEERHDLSTTRRLVIRLASSKSIPDAEFVLIVKKLLDVDF